MVFEDSTSVITEMLCKRYANCIDMSVAINNQRPHALRHKYRAQHKNAIDATYCILMSFRYCTCIIGRFRTVFLSLYLIHLFL